VFGPQVKHGVNLGIRGTFGDIAATIADGTHVPAPLIGTSFLSEIV
jgi:phosphopentomutase